MPLAQSYPWRSRYGPGQRTLLVVGLWSAQTLLSAAIEN